MTQTAYSGVDSLEMLAQLAPNYNGYLASLVEKHLHEGEHILDFGAGIGTFAEILAARGYHITCVELDEQLQLHLRDKNLPTCRSIEDLPADSVPAAFTFNVLEHIEDDVDAMRQIYERLRPGGKLLIYVPAFQVLFSSMDRKVGHFRRYTRGMLTERLHRVGFNIQLARYADSLGFPASLVFKWFGNDSGELNPAGLKTYDRFVFPLSRVLDILACHCVGKNVVVVAQKPNH